MYFILRTIITLANCEDDEHEEDQEIFDTFAFNDNKVSFHIND